MRKLGISFLAVLIIFLSAFCFANNGGDAEYLRIHVRANSDSAFDQAVKYEIRDEVVGYLTPKVEAARSKKEALEVVEKEKIAIKRLIDGYLSEKGYGYSSSVRTVNEYFPTRKYEELTLDAGYYDALIIELGKGEGANWWCVVYPPLCFSGENIKYRSIIYEKLAEIFN